MKTIEGRITILVNDNKVLVELRDELSRVKFAKVELTPSEFCRLLSRTVEIDCTIDINGLEKVGKKLIISHLEFEMPDGGWGNREDTARQLVVEKCPEGWEPDLYFGSRDNFFRRDNKNWVRATIRKWVEVTTDGQ